MFRLCLKDWSEYKKSNPWAKMIVLANNIDIAEKYNQWFRDAGYRFNIATSGDEKLSKETIRRFKLDNSEYNSYDGMIGIGKIYKGLDIKAATFLVFLINIRGKSWADQAIGRVQRAFKSKKKAFVYAPNDPKMRMILKQLECGEIKNAEFDQDIQPPPKPDPEPFLVCLKRMEVEPEKAIYVGDDWLIDICGAEEVGIQPVWLKHHSVSRTWPKVETQVPVITSLEQLLDLDL